MFATPTKLSREPSCKDSSLAPTRALALDALRGLAILLMILSGLEPFGVLPAWMYHGQTPPPSHLFNAAIPGITWVDLVFPFFIFSMGAAFPLALSKKLDENVSIFATVTKFAKRGLALLAFAIFHQHFNPRVVSSDPSSLVWLSGLGAFVLAMLLWGQFPWKMSGRIAKIIKYGAWLLAIIAFALVQYPDGSGFSVFRSNIILLVLANLAFWGSLVWFITRKSIEARLVIMAVIMAIYLSGSASGNWFSEVSNIRGLPFLAGFLHQHFAFGGDYNWISDLTWIGDWRFLKYLLVIIPGTIAGDLLLDHLKTTSTQQVLTAHLRKGNLIFASVCFAIIILVLIGLKGRWPAATLFVSLGFIVVGRHLLPSAAGQPGNLYRSLYLWASVWLALGLLLEPFEGGIKKDPCNLSYFFVSSGLAIFALICFNILIEFFSGNNVLALLIRSGQNPMLAYICSSNLLLPVLGLVCLVKPFIAFGQSVPWAGFILAVVFTWAIGIFVATLSKYKIFLRT